MRDGNTPERDRRFGRGHLRTYGRAVPSASGLLLTGGRSRRLGTDKARLLLDGETLAARAGGRLAVVCDLVVEVGLGITARPHACERPAGSGPLAALAAGGVALQELGWDGPALLLAVDLPNVDVPLLELLRDWPGPPTVIPEAGGRPQPVCARYGPEALRAASSLVAAEVRALHDLLDVADYDVVPEAVWRTVAPADAFSDIDTPEDATRFGIDLSGLP
jgi:molybdenum cofactor guanylyltransferase